MSAPAPVLGIDEIDRELSSYMPPGWIGILLGGSGSGMSLFAKQFAQAGGGGIPVLYYTTYERTDDIQKAFRDFGWSSSGIQVVNLSDEYYERVLRRDLEVSRLRERGLTYKDLIDTSNAPVRRRSYNLTSRLLSDLAGLDHPFRLVVDSIDFFLEVLDPGEVMMMVRQIRHRVQSLGGQALLVMVSEVHDRRTTGLLEDLADLVVELGAGPATDSFEQMFAIRKVRNHPEKTSVGVARMTPHGLIVPPRPPPAATPDARRG
ncbi:MAG TPA: ATPase domain-containing protein [Thermoplasmata archaeon]|nr:ATPase domain-containing protein [Thermoplasmata archaeon]